MTRQLLILSFIIGLIQCSSPKKELSSLIEIVSGLESIPGKAAYLESPYVTAGDRVYMVGHQDGSFPDLGWHITGEMGGIWDHPIKLMDGFSILILGEDLVWNVSRADEFKNFPFGNLHTFEKDELVLERFQFAPDGMEGLVVELSISNNSNATKEIELIFTGHVDLRPTWLAEREGIVDGEDQGTYDDQSNTFTASDSQNPWFVTFGSDKEFGNSEKGTSINRTGRGRDYALENGFSIPSGGKEIIRFFIAGSYESRENSITTFNKLKADPEGLLQKKINLYQSLEATNSLTSGDREFDQMFRWIKYNTQWLVRDVPKIGRGVSAGIPDYPWWFGTDGAYIIQGLVSAGMHEEAMNTIDLIIELSRKENGNGKIVHEVSSNGIVFNPGNLNTTPTFIHALWKAYEWTGNEKILDYYEDVKQGITWIESKDTDGNGYPDGAGMMEIHGLHSEMIDVVAYLAKAYKAVSNFAEVKGDPETTSKYAAKAKILKQKINSDWWVEESKSYADFRSSKEEALELIDAAIVRADTINKPWSVEELKITKEEVELVPDELQGFVVHHNWVVNTPMEVGIADSNKAKSALATAEKYRNKFGMFVTGIDRDEKQEKAEKWKAFSYVGAVMTLPTGVEAIGEARYGNSDASLEYLKMLQNSFSYALPGSMYEVSPDFGMVAQGWNVYAVAVPIVDYFFGIQPEAYNQKIVIGPQMPSSWNEAKLENIKIGENEISISFKRDREKETYEISQKLDWEINFAGSPNQIGIIN